jgi:Ca2+-binding RTX toxin-like protein
MNWKKLLLSFYLNYNKKISSLIVTIYIFLLLSIFAADANATHLSKPIITMDKTSFKANEVMTVKGWVDYFGPTSDVLLDILIRTPNGTIALRDTVKSDSYANFSFGFRLPSIMSPGNYILQVISQCRDEHRDICANESSSISISIGTTPNKMLNTITPNISNSSKSPLLTNQLLGKRVSEGISLTEEMNITQEQKNPTFNCTKLKVNVHGTEKNDTLIGTGGNDVIDALGGNDIIFGLSGNDIICGGNNDDLIFGELGNDKIYGGNGNDKIDGGYGNDFINGGNGNDKIYGEYGYDILYGGYGNDTAYGGSGYNLCFEFDITHDCG